MNRLSATTGLARKAAALICTLIALLAAPAAAKSCAEETGIRTDIEQVRAQCLDAVGALVAIELSREGTSTTPPVTTLQACAESARMLGICDKDQRCVFSGVNVSPALPKCGASPRRLSSLGLAAVNLWTQAVGGSDGARQPDAQQRLQWNDFLFKLYGERCRSLSGCWNWLKSRAFSSDRSDYRDHELAARIDQTSRRLDGASTELTKALNVAWNGTGEVGEEGLQPMVKEGASSLTSLARDAGAIRKHIEAIPYVTTPKQPGASTDVIVQPVDLTPLASAIDRLTEKVATLKPSQEKSGQPAAPAPQSQISPNDDYEKVFTQAQSIGYAVLLVPDPRVPRHRRSYDMSIASVSQAMLAEDFVPDRYSMPWQEYLDNPTAKPVATTPTPAPPGARYVDDGRFGVLLYRRDGWRNGGTGYEIRVLFVVAETASFGVQQRAFMGAVARVLEKATCEVAKPRQFTLSYANEAAPAAACPASQPLSIIGPAFSGSITSVVEALRQVDDSLKQRKTDCQTLAAQEAVRAAANETARNPLGLRDQLVDRAQLARHHRKALIQCQNKTKAIAAADCSEGGQCIKVHTNLVSPATTASSNDELPTLAKSVQPSRFQVSYERLAVSDSRKLEKLEDLLHPRKVVLFAEASIFGNGICAHKSDLAICQKATTIHFPSNIADIRYGQNTLDKARRQQMQSSLKLAPSPDALALEDGAENGSEFPESQRSPLSTVSASAALERSIDLAREHRPDLIIVAATDVRDRLFLFDRLRLRIPSAQLVDLETDVLMSHPGFIHASRGSLLLGSARLSGGGPPAAGTLSSDSAASKDQSSATEPLASFATDDQALLYAAIRGLCDPHQPLACSAGQAEKKMSPFERRDNEGREPILHMPTHQGLIEIGPNTLQPRFWRIAYYLALATLAIVALVFLHLLLRPRRGASWLRRSAAAATAIFLLGVSLLLLDLSSPTRDGRQLSALSGVSPWAALAIVAVAVVLVAYYAYRTRIACAMSSTLTGGSLFATPPARQQNIIAPLDLANGNIALPATVGLLLWLWLVINQPASRHGLLQHCVEALLTYAQPFVAFAATAGLVLSAAWAHCAMVSANRIGAMAQRLNGNGLPPWSGLPGFLVGSIVEKTSQNPLEKLAHHISGGDGELRAVPPAGDSALTAPTATLRARPRFAATPLLVRSRYFAWLDEALTGTQPPNPNPGGFELERLCQMQFDFSDSLRERALLALILARQVEAARYSLYFGLLMALALPLLVYSYPLAGGERYALFGLALVLAGAFFSAFLLYRMQHLPSLDRLLCDGEGKTKIEYQTLTALFSPLLMAVFAWAVVKMPGVLDWSGGLFEVLLGAFKR